MVIRSFVAFTRRHPISRGMIAYAILWPTSNVTQQLIHGRESIDWNQALRFSMFGAFYTAPTIYAWVRTVGILIPGNTLRVVLTKVLVEQIVYAPFAVSGFYIGLGLLEGKSWQGAVEELKEKFLPTYKVGLCVWPLAQTLNFLFIKERNRVMFTGTVSFFWTIWMSYMKSLEVQNCQGLSPSSSSTTDCPQVPAMPKLSPN